jgi:SAM-dependent methyltransferase
VTALAPVRPLRDRDFIFEYARQAPLALALERAMECRLLADYPLERPVLDVGCGDGRFVEILYGTAGGIDYGLDPDPLETARAVRRNVYRTVLTASATAIPLPDASIATVISNSTLEHIHPLREVLAEVVRVLHRGGTLLITVPTDRFDRYPVIYRVLRGLGLDGAAERFRLRYDRFWHHYHFYAPDEWRALLQESGFRVDEIAEYDSAAGCAAHDALVPVAFPAFLAKKVFDRYVLFPRVRAVAIRIARPLLPRDRTDRLPAGRGGLVFLRAAKP